MTLKNGPTDANRSGACLKGGGRILIAFAALGVALSCGARESVELRTNPFIRPDLSLRAPEPTEASGPLHSTSPPTRLRFTLAAGPHSLVNVDGRTLRIGEEINGYRLEAVGADTAIFSNGEEIVELKVRPSDLGSRK